MSKSFMELIQSEPFCRLLAHMTGLDLAHNVIRPKLSPQEQIDSENEEGCSIREDNPTNQLVGEKKDNEPSSTTKGDSGDNGESYPVGSNDSESPAAVCRCDLYSWHPGDYTLAGDESDPGNGVFCLVAMFNLSCEGTQYIYHNCLNSERKHAVIPVFLVYAGWSVDQGGATSYIAKDDDEEVGLM